MCAQSVAEDPSFLHEDAQADLSLRWVHVILLVLSRGGSYSLLDGEPTSKTLQDKKKKKVFSMPFGAVIFLSQTDFGI